MAMVSPNGLLIRLIFVIMTKNCREGRSKACGKGCIPLIRTCRKDPKKYAAATSVQIQQEMAKFTANGGKAEKKARKPPVCTEGVTRKCGKVCRSVDKVCKQKGFEYKPGVTKAQKRVEREMRELKEAQELLKKENEEWDDFVKQNEEDEGDETSGVI